MAGFGYRMYRTLGPRVDWFGQPGQPFLQSTRHSIVYVDYVVVEDGFPSPSQERIAAVCKSSQDLCFFQPPRAMG